MKNILSCCNLKSKNNQSGQALVTLIIFIAVALVITSGLVVVSIVSTQSGTVWGKGQEALYVAESGVENALIRLLRDPSYSGEVINVEIGTAQITVSGYPNITIVSKGIVDNSIRKIQVLADYNNNELKIISWKEID